MYKIRKIFDFYDSKISSYKTVEYAKIFSDFCIIRNNIKIYTEINKGY